MTDTIKKLATASGTGNRIAVSPDGDVYYTVEVDGGYQLACDGEIITDSEHSLGIVEWLDGRGTILMTEAVDGDSQQNLVEVESDTGETTRVLDSDYHITQPRQSPTDSNIVGIITGKDGGLDFYTLDIDTGELELRVSGEPFIGAFNWAPDGERIAYMNAYQNDTSLHIYNLRTDESETLFDEEGTEQKLYAPDKARYALWGDRGLLFTSNHHSDTKDIGLMQDDGEYEWVVESPHEKSLIGWSPDVDKFAFVELIGCEALLKMWEDGDVRVVTEHGWTRSSRWVSNESIAYVLTDHETPNNLYIDGERVTDEEIELNELGLVEPEYVEIDTDYGVLPALLYEPEDADAALVHAIGGPGTWVQNEYHWREQALAKSGFAILKVAYRGCMGHGRSHREGNTGALGVTDVQDVARGGEFLRERGYENIGVYGHSFGAYLATASATETEVFDAHVNIAGPADWLEWVEHTRGFSRIGIIRKMGVPPEDDPELWRERSPIYSFDEVEAPMMVVQPENDRAMPPQNGDKIAEALDEHGITNEYLYIENDGHFISKPENKVLTVESIAEFCHEHLK